MARTISEIVPNSKQILQAGDLTLQVACLLSPPRVPRSRELTDFGPGKWMKCRIPWEVWRTNTLTSLAEAVCNTKSATRRSGQRIRVEHLRQLAVNDSRFYGLARTQALTIP